MANLYTQAVEAAGGDTHNHQQGRSNIKWGRVVEMDPDNCRVRIETDEQDLMVSYWLQCTFPKTLHDKYYWMPDIDEPVYFVYDEQGEEAPKLGAFYTPKVLPHEPDVDKTEVYWRDCSYERYHRTEHLRETYIRGDYEVTAKRLVITAEELILNVGSLTLNAERVVINTGTPALLNGAEIAVLGAVDNAGHALVTSGQSPWASPEIIVEEPCWDGETELVGDLRNLSIANVREPWR